MGIDIETRIGSPNERDLARWCEEEFPRLVGILTLHVSDKGIAEELAQEALFQACRQWPKVQLLDSPSSWVTRVALNMANSWWRRRFAERRARQKIDVGMTSFTDDIAARMVIRESISRLPRRQREAVLLRFYGGFTIARTAQIMGCAEGTVKALTHHGVNNLRAEMMATEEMEMYP